MIQFQNVPHDGIKASTPDGHYIDMRGDVAQIISVGGHPGIAAYESALPGYRVTSIDVLPFEDMAKFGDLFDTRLKAR